MDIFFSLFTSILPLYIIIALGWVAGRFYDVRKESLANLAIYIIVPIVAFYYVSGLKFQASFAALPVFVFLIYSFITIVAFKIGQRIYPDKRANLLAMCSGASNTGYMGLPIVILLFPTEWVGVYVFALLGGLIYEATVFYYIANRGAFDPKESFIRVLKFPVIYATILALIVNYFQIELPSQLNDFWAYFKGAYVVIGMMIIGISLSRVSRLVMSAKFLALVFVSQFIVWPLMAYGLILLDQSVMQWFTPEIYKLLIVLSLVPPAANIAAFAATLDLNPEKAATTVLLGTIFALFYIPAVLVLSGLF